MVSNASYWLLMHMYLLCISIVYVAFITYSNVIASRFPISTPARRTLLLRYMISGSLLGHIEKNKNKKNKQTKNKWYNEPRWHENLPLAWWLARCHPLCHSKFPVPVAPAQGWDGVSSLAGRRKRPCGLGCPPGIQRWSQSSLCRPDETLRRPWR